MAVSEEGRPSSAKKAPGSVWQLLVFFLIGPTNGRLIRITTIRPTSDLFGFSASLRCIRTCDVACVCLFVCVHLSDGLFDGVWWFSLWFACWFVWKFAWWFVGWFICLMDCLMVCSLQLEDQALLYVVRLEVLIATSSQGKLYWCDHRRPSSVLTCLINKV